MADDIVLKNAQYRKGMGIGFFNATNTAIEILKREMEITPPEKQNDEWFKSRLVFWRTWLIEEHKDYYAKNIANIGQTYDAKATIERLQKTQSLEELHSVWLTLTEDERRDGEILKVKNLLKKPYEKA